VNDPVYFHEFVAQAKRSDWRFLQKPTSLMTVPTCRAAREARRTAAIVLRGQYLDFVKCRRFRQSLLTRAVTRGAGSVRENVERCSSHRPQRRN
jgi:hypothetical protein